MTNQLPERDKLAAMLKFINASSQEDWVNVTLAVGRAYGQSPDMYEVVKAWGETYPERTPADAQRERHNYFMASRQPGGVSIGTVFELARRGGWTPAMDAARTVPQRRETFTPPVITIDAGIARAESDPDKAISEMNLIRESRAALHAVLSFFVFDSSALEDSGRMTFLVDNAPLFNELPKLEKACFKALKRYCTEVSPAGYSAAAFLNWAVAQGGDVPDSREGWLAACERADFAPVNDCDEAVRVFARAATQARLLRLHFQARELAGEFLHIAAGITDPEAALASARACIGQLSAAAVESDSNLEYARGAEIADAARENVADAIDPARRHRLFLPTGHLALDAHINGYARKEVTIMAAHSGVGKTWYGVDAARLAAAAGYRVLFFSTEMTTGGVAARMAMNINQTSIRHLQAAFQHYGTDNNPDCQQFYANAHDFLTNSANVTLVSPKRGGLSIEQIEADMARFAMEGPLDLVIVDYLQNVHNDNPRLATAPHYQRVQDVMERLTSLAIEHDACLLATAQLNNPNRKQGSDPTPNLYDIADATSVVRSAAAVMMLYQVSTGEDLNGNAIFETRAKVTKSRYGTCTSSPLQVRRLVGSRFEFAP